MSAHRARALTWLSDGLPVVFAVPVLLGIVTSVVKLLSVGHPYLGWATTVDGDGEALYLGVPIHQDPADGYTGQLYTPLFPFVVSLLDRITFWTGFPLLLAELSGAGLLVLAVWLARRPGNRLSWLGALGIGALAWWTVSALDLPLLYEGRSDQFAWLLAIAGLVATARAGRVGDARASALAVALLSAAFWTKQNTIPASIAAVAWLALLALCGALAVRRAVTFAAALLATNVAVLGLLNLLSGGWEWRLNFAYPTHHSQSHLLTPWIREGLSGGAPAYAFLAAMLAAVLGRRPARPGPLRELLGSTRRAVATWHARTTTAAAAAGPLALLLAIGFLTAVYFRRKQGGADNQFIGVTWAAALLGATLWRAAGASLRRSLAAGAIVVAGFAIALTGALDHRLADHGVTVPKLHPVAQYVEVPPNLRALADRGLTYDSLFGDLNVQTRRKIYPNYYNFVDLLAAGSQPLWLVRQFEDRRFLYTALLPEDPGSQAYASAYGKWEENWLWKVNRVIEARYAPDSATPGVLRRRPGPEEDAWQRTCFGPFRAGGVSWRIGHGGGFWCSPSPGIVTQRGTPAPLTQLRTTGAVRGVAGTLRVVLAAGHGVIVNVDGDDNGDALHVDRLATGAYQVSVWAAGRAVGTQLLRGSTATVALRSGPAALRGTTATLTLSGTLQLVTGQDSGLRADLRGLRVTPR